MGTAIPGRVGALIAVFVAAGLLLFGVLGFGFFFGAKLGFLLGVGFYHLLTREEVDPF